jgi:hypothetical protein
MNQFAETSMTPYCPDAEVTRLLICIPVFNDWHSVAILLKNVDRVFSESKILVTIVLVDDGSTERHEGVVLHHGQSAVRILRLTRNMGHQRAIAIGLAAIADKFECDAVVVMDGDGEDNPVDIPVLLFELQKHHPPAVIFAQRMRRTETLKFKLGYACFKVLHRLLTGRPCDVGNFSVIPAVWLKRLVCSSELWIHYAAAVACSRLPIVKVPCNRGQRYAGQSHMKLTSLVVHGLSAISVFGETVGVRICLALGAITGVTVVGLMAVLYLRFMTDLAVPGWATSATGLLLILLVNLLLLTMNSVLVILGARNNASFVPSRDWSTFVSGWTVIHE